MNIAASRNEFDANPGAFDGFIEKRLKRQVDLVVHEKLYAINRYGLLCKRRPLSKGRVWYSFCSSIDELFESDDETRKFVLGFALGKDARGLFFK